MGSQISAKKRARDESQPQVDFERLVLIARSVGLNQKRFAAQLGIDPGHLRRVTTGKSRALPELVSRAIELLHLHPSDVESSGDDQWVRFHTTRRDLMGEFHEQFQNAESVLTITNSAESYLQEEWMLEWSNRVWLGIRDWEQHKESLYPYAKEQVGARDRSNFLHRIVCPWELFIAAKAQNDQWLDRIRHGLGAFEGMTAVTPVRNWDRVCQQCSEHLPPDSTGWNKLCIVDSIRVLIHVQQEWHLTCSNERAVRNLKRAIEEILSKEVPGFLRESQIRLTSMREASHQTEDTIEDILRGTAELERAYPYWLAFARLLCQEAYVPPTVFVERRPVGRVRFG